MADTSTFSKDVCYTLMDMLKGLAQHPLNWHELHVYFDTFEPNCHVDTQYKIPTIASMMKDTAGGK